MNKIYQKPDAEYVSLVAREEVTTDNDDFLDGEVGIESSDF